MKKRGTRTAPRGAAHTPHSRGGHVETDVSDEPSASKPFEFSFEGEAMGEERVRELVHAELTEYHDEIRAGEKKGDTKVPGGKSDDESDGESD